MENELKICKCSCQCNSKLLTITSQKRLICSSCIIGNCKGKGVLKTYYGGRFETNISEKPNFGQLHSIKQAYPIQNKTNENKKESE